jgi:1-acyl-sn-glycerol-3-phosphate acyltransferase
MSGAAGTATGADATAQRVAAAGFEFLNGMRQGVEGGLDPLAAAEAAASSLPAALRESVGRMARRMRGTYHEDEWGFDEEFAEAAYPLFEFLYDRWWRVEAKGAAHVPAHGRAMLVSNHAGSLFPFDASMITAALMKEHPLPRWPRFMVLDWAFELPFLAPFMRKVGGVPASPFNATRILESDGLMMVFPEGAKGTGKPFAERYQLQRFGRGGFVEIALRTRSPIVPIAVVGAEEIYPMLGDAKPIARAIGAPFVPITPTFPWLGPLGLVPLPSRWRIEFCEPIDISQYPAEAAEDRRIVFELSEQVRERIQDKLYENLVDRGSAFL